VRGSGSEDLGMSGRVVTTRRGLLTGAFTRRRPLPLQESEPRRASLKQILEDLNDLSGIVEPPPPMDRRSSTMKTKIMLFALTFALFSPAAAIAGDTKQADDGLDVWFRAEAIESLSKQEQAVFIDTATGESKPLERAFPDAPPQIPHTLEDMLPLTADDNECLECHHPDNVTSKKDMPLPKTHFERPVMKDGNVAGYEKADDFVGARYRCTMCHVPSATNVKTPASSFQRVKTSEDE
jgi:cytochrome c-type protein NapB